MIDANGFRLSQYISRVEVSDKDIFGILRVRVSWYF